MPRYLPSHSLQSVLDRGKAVEQFLGRSVPNGCFLVRWIELRPGRSGVEVRLFEAGEPPGFETMDIYEWIDTDIDQPSGIFSTVVEALDFAFSTFNASPDRWVNEGVVQDEYHDCVVADRALHCCDVT